MLPKRAEKEFVEVIQSHGWDYKTLGGMANLQLAAAVGDEKARVLLETREVKEMLAEFRKALEPVQSIVGDTVNQSILQRVKQLSDSNDQIWAGLSDTLWGSTLDEVRRNVESRLIESASIPNSTDHPTVKIGDSPDVKKTKFDIERLSHEGYPIKVISQRVGVSESSVKRYRKELGIKKRREH